MSKFLTRATLAAAFLLNAGACFADEIESTSVETSTPVETSSTSVKTKRDATGSSTSVKKKRATTDGASTTEFKAKAGPNGAAVSKSKKKVRQNIDGSVSSSKSEETHAVNGAGAVHKRTDAAETVGTDGSSTSVKRETTKTE
jgi:hypothetical protein